MDKDAGAELKDPQLLFLAKCGYHRSLEMFLGINISLQLRWGSAVRLKGLPS
jgi:hypothetical protein